MNYYDMYTLLDYFVRSEDRIFKLNRSSKLTPSIKAIIDLNLGITIDSDTKVLMADDMIGISTNNIIAKDYILYNSNKVLVLFIPESIRSDEYTVENKAKTIFNLCRDNTFRRTNSIYSLQIELMPLFITCAILFKMYEPFNDLCNTICNAVLPTLSEEDKKSVKDIMDFIYNSMDDNTFFENVFNNGFMSTIINKDLASSIVNSYTPLNS